MTEMAENSLCYQRYSRHLLIFAKTDVNQHENTCFSSKESFEKTRPPGAVITCESPGVGQGGWSGLELTDT